MAEENANLLVWAKMKKFSFSKEQEARINRVMRLADVRLVLVDLGIEYTERKRNDLWFKCQNLSHRESDASTHICTDKFSSTHALWHCFGCQDSGNIIQLVQVTLQIAFWEAVNWIEGRLGEAPDVDERLTVRQVQPLPTLPTEYVSPTSSTDWEPVYLSYLFNRGVTWEQIKKHRIGYCNEGKYKGRVIVPVMLGTVLQTWVGRTILGKGLRVTSCTNGKVGLFASDWASPKNGPIILVEGWADALRLERLGYKNVVALQTNIVHPLQFEFIRRFPYCILMPDNDDGGMRLCNSIGQYIDRLDFFCAWIREGKDPGDKNESDEDIVRAVKNLEPWKVKVIEPDWEICL